MNKTTFTAILQIALWRFEGMNQQKIKEIVANSQSKVPKSVVQAGFQLCAYLKNLKINPENEVK